MDETLKRRHSEEVKAASDYTRDAVSFRKSGDVKTARVLLHIRDEEKEHARELEERMNSMARLTYAQRKKMPTSSFALPGKREGGKGGYPIQDAAHARNALARVAQHGSPSEKARVRAAVHRRYPGIGKSKGVPLSSMARAK